jgi:hypothetical protein
VDLKVHRVVLVQLALLEQLVVVVLKGGQLGLLVHRVLPGLLEVLEQREQLDHRVPTIQT